MRREVVERFRGRYVAIDESGNVVADADELDEIFALLQDKGLTADVVQRIPEADAPYFVGLG